MYTHYSVQERIGAFLLIFSTTLSLLSTCVNIYLIRDINIWNGHTILVFILTIFQFLYDISFYFLLGFTSDACYTIYKFLYAFSGTFISLWINFISLILYFTITYVETFDIKQHYRIVFTANFLFSLGLAISLILVYQLDDSNYVVEFIFYWLRIGSIGFNLIIYFITTVQLYDQYSETTKYLEYVCMSVVKKNPLRTKASDLLLVLSSRLKYYPLVQIISLAGAAWWDYQYGFSTSSFDNTSFSARKEASFYLYVICSPLAGVGYFIVFLAVQPLAYQRFKSLIMKFFMKYYICRVLYSCCGLRSSKTDLRPASSLSKESVSTETLTTDLFTVASRKNSEAGKINLYVPNQPNNISLISMDLNLPEYKKRLEAIQSMRKESSRSVSGVIEEPVTFNPLSESSKPSYTESIDSRSRLKSRATSQDSIRSFSTDIKTPNMSQPSEGGLLPIRSSDVSSVKQRFTIESRHTRGSKILYMTEEVIWEEIEKIRKESEERLSSRNQIV